MIDLQEPPSVKPEMLTEYCSEECDHVHGGEHCCLRAALDFVEKVGCYGYAYEVLRLAQATANKLRDTK